MAFAVALVLMAIGTASAQEGTAWAIPPGQESVVVRMTGLGETLGGCTGGDVRVEQAAVRASYECAERTIEIRLVHPHAADRSARRTRRFALLAPDAPPALLDAVAERVAAHEETFAWVRVGDDGDGAPAFPEMTPSTATATGLPADIAGPYGRGLSLHRAGRFEEALALYLDLARRHPRDGVLGMVVASLASTRPDLELASALAQQADAAPGDPLAAFVAGVALHYYAHQSGRDRFEKERCYEQAIRYLGRARPAYDFEPRLYIYLAVSHFRLGRQEEAEALIERAVELGEGDPDAYYCRAEIFQRRNVARSIADLSRYLQRSEALAAQGSVISESKEAQVRRMLQHLRAVERGEAAGGELFDPTGGGPFLLRPGAEPRRFAAGVLLAAGAVFGLWTFVHARRRRREPG